MPGDAIGLTLKALEGLSDNAFERLYGPKLVGAVARPLPDLTSIHTEVSGAPALELLQLGYLQAASGRLPLFRVLPLHLQPTWKLAAVVVTVGNS